MEPVLVGIDFSDGSALALRYGRLLAHQLKSPLLYLHVAEEPGAVGPGPRDPRAWLDRAGVPAAELATRTGIPWIEIVRMAGSTGATAVTLGSHGNGGFHPITLGSTAARVSIAAPCPVLIVGARARRETLILYKPDRRASETSEEI